MRDFPRIKRLPPYVFNITGELKTAARRRGEDIIDMSMGNPDGETPRHIVDKLVEAAQRENTHGYWLSKGIPRRRKAARGMIEAGWTVEVPKATMYIWAKIPEPYLRMGSLDFAKKLLADAMVKRRSCGRSQNEARIRQAIRGIGRIFRKDGLS